MRTLLLVGAGLLVLAALPGAQATSVWLCVGPNIACAGAGAGLVGPYPYVDVCLYPALACTYPVPPTALPVPPGVYPGPTCEAVNNPPVVLAVCAGG
jgi:hypothetical protein